MHRLIGVDAFARSRQVLRQFLDQGLQGDGSGLGNRAGARDEGSEIDKVIEGAWGEDGVAADLVHVAEERFAHPGRLFDALWMQARGGLDAHDGLARLRRQDV